MPAYPLSKFITCFLILSLTVVLKLIPHLPNFSPQIVFSLYLATFLNKRQLLVAVLLTTLLTDFCYGWFMHFSVFGSWTLFTYSAFLALSFTTQALKISANRWSFIFISLLASYGFWLWTNLGSWILSGLYAHSFAGLIQCYALALPFLTSTLLGGLFWSTAIVSLYQILEVTCYKEGLLAIRGG